MAEIESLYFYCARCGALNRPFGARVAERPLSTRVTCSSCGSKQLVSWLDSDEDELKLSESESSAEDVGTRE